VLFGYLFCSLCCLCHYLLFVLFVYSCCSLCCLCVIICFLCCSLICVSLFVICVVRLFLLFSVLFMCKCVLPPGDNTPAVNKKESFCLMVEASDHGCLTHKTYTCHTVQIFFERVTMYNNAKRTRGKLQRFISTVLQFSATRYARV
jgi:hypothetical protein